MVQPVGDEKDDLILGVLLQVNKHGILGAAVQRREWVVQYQHRPGMRQRAGQRQPLGLPAGKPCAAGTDHGVHTVLHGLHFVFQRHSSQPGHRVLLAAAQHVVLHGVGAQLRVMPQVADGGCNFPRRQRREFFAAEPGRAAIGSFTQKYTPQSGFSAGHRPRNADDLPRVGCQIQPRKNRLLGIPKGQIL